MSKPAFHQQHAGIDAFSLDVLVVAKGVPNDVELRLRETNGEYLELKRSED